jgi:hypothetical protein
MRKNQLASALAAAVVGIAGIANLSNAININPDGTGQVLIYPFYTIEAGQDTLISVVNTANEVKAVKVRFHEKVNSREPLDFHLYLSPFDVWTATIRNNPNGDAANGFPILFTRDNSCTVPAIRGNVLLPQLPAALGGDRYAEFSGLRMPGRPASDARSGYIEMMEMGVVGAVAGFNPAGAATHSGAPGGSPGGCQTLINAWSNGGVWEGSNGVPLPAFPLGSNTAISVPTGGLFGGASVVNVEQGRLISYNATAIEGVAFTGTGGNHQNPASIAPQLSGYLASAVQTANVFVGGRLISSVYAPASPAAGIVALGATLAAQNQVNEYAFTTDSTFRSEWVVTFPTKRFHTDAPNAVAAVPVPPFQRRSDEGGGCEDVALTVWDREEFRVPFVNFSPSLIPALCAEVNIVNFEVLPQGGTGTSGLPALAATPILGGRTDRPGVLRAGIPGPTQAGWANLSFQTSTTNRAFPTSSDGDTWFGLPTIGFWVLAVENNAAAPGIRAFYSGAFANRTQRRCENPAGC